ncbi:MAG TPA: thioesterase family protein [Chloroflexota bacterium]|nr:thioesterase family protein [Chloroflexota bacterium]
MLTPGLRGEAHLTVDFTLTAAALGDFGVVVLGTPYMINLMEIASARAVEAELEPGQTTVGTVVDVKHLAATPIDMKVTAMARLVEVEGRRLVFDVEAHDEREKIGEGRHERFILDLDRFLRRTRAKQESPPPNLPSA